MYDQKKLERSAFLTTFFLSGGIITANHLRVYQKLPEGKRSNPFFYLCTNIQINTGKSILEDKTWEIRITIGGC